MTRITIRRRELRLRSRGDRIGILRDCDSCSGEEHDYCHGARSAADSCVRGLLIKKPWEPTVIVHMKPHLKKLAYLKSLTFVRLIDFMPRLPMETRQRSATGRRSEEHTSELQS